jgi:hypothetical protein
VRPRGRTTTKDITSNRFQQVCKANDCCRFGFAVAVGRGRYRSVHRTFETCRLF